MFVIYIGFEFDLFGLSCLFCFGVLGLFGFVLKFMGWLVCGLI